MTAERQDQAISGLRPHHARLRFERLPAAYSHPRRIAVLLPEGLPTGFRDRLLASARLRLRLSRLIAKRFALEPCPPEGLTTPEGRFVQLEGEALQDAIRRVGAIWHARTVSRIILGEPLRRLVERLGRDNYRAALGLIDLAADSGDDPPEVDVLVGWIERDGLIAVNAWSRQQPAALAKRLRLKLPPGPEVDDEPPATHRDRGSLIVDHVVMGLTDDHLGKAGSHG